MRFDPEWNAWVVSRYADVLAALREPRLRVIAPDGGPDVGRDGGPDEGPDGGDAVREAVQTALSGARLAGWQERLEAFEVPEGGAIDLMAEFARPWSLRAAVTITEADAGDAARLEALARRVSAAAAEPKDDALKASARAASAEMEGAFANAPFPMPVGAFVALSQTLPCLLGNMWLALLENPAELARLQAQPELMAGAVEELLRFTTLAQTLFRTAAARLVFAGMEIAEGQRVALMLAEANRDPEQFAEPDRLDITRRAGSQLSLGAGPHACVAAPLIRMAVSAATRAFVGRFARARLAAPVEWSGGSGFRFPAALRVL